MEAIVFTMQGIEKAEIAVVHSPVDTTDYRPNGGVTYTIARNEKHAFFKFDRYIPVELFNAISGGRTVIIDDYKVAFRSKSVDAFYVTSRSKGSKVRTLYAYKTPFGYKYKVVEAPINQDDIDETKPFNESVVKEDYISDGMCQSIAMNAFDVFDIKGSYPYFHI